MDMSPLDALISLIPAFALFFSWPYVLLGVLKLIKWLRRKRLDYDEVRRGYARALLEQLARDSNHK